MWRSGIISTRRFPRSWRWSTSCTWSKTPPGSPRGRPLRPPSERGALGGDREERAGVRNAVAAGRPGSGAGGGDPGGLADQREAQVAEHRGGRGDRGGDPFDGHGRSPRAGIHGRKGDPEDGVRPQETREHRRLVLSLVYTLTNESVARARRPPEVYPLRSRHSRAAASAPASLPALTVPRGV